MMHSGSTGAQPGQDQSTAWASPSADPGSAGLQPVPTCDLEARAPGSRTPACPAITLPLPFPFALSPFRAVAFSFSLLLPVTGCARRAPAAPAGLFQEVAAQAGISFRHSNGARGMFYMIETTGSGCALFDYDNDQRLDVLLIQSGPLPGDTGQRRNGLYRNVGKPGVPWFLDVTTGSGLEDSGYGQGAAV